MGIGVNIGAQIGIDAGANIGQVGSATAADVDAVSGKAVPTTAAQMVARGIAAPQALWLPNATLAGDLLDQVGALHLVAANSPLYQQPIAGWATKAVYGTVAATNARFSAAGADVSTTPICLLWYVHVTQCTDVNFQFIEHGDPRIQQVAGAQTLRLRNTTNLADTTGSHTGVHPIMLLHDPVNTRTRLFSDVEKLTAVFAASVGTNLQISPAGAAETTGRFAFLWGCEWTGVDAQISDATAKDRLQRLNWTIPWS